jgi:hypothetical protein
LDSCNAVTVNVDDYAGFTIRNPLLIPGASELNSFSVCKRTLGGFVKLHSERAAWVIRDNATGVAELHRQAIRFAIYPDYRGIVTTFRAGGLVVAVKPNDIASAVGCRELPVFTRHVLPRLQNACDMTIFTQKTGYLQFIADGAIEFAPRFVIG